MGAYADLELGLHRWTADRYTLELRFSQPGSDADVRLTRGEPPRVGFDFEELLALAADDAAYGRHLADNLFADPAVATAFDKALSNAQSLGSPLRLGRYIGPSAAELHRPRGGARSQRSSRKRKPTGRSPWAWVVLPLEMI